MFVKVIPVFLRMSTLCISKLLLLNISQHATEERNVDKSYDDYMADIEIQSVNAGNPVELKCTSPKDISACFFSKTNEFIYYKIQPKSTFPDKRLQCLCDVSNYVSGYNVS